MVDTLRELTSGVLAQLNYCIEMGNGAVGLTCNFYGGCICVQDSRQ
jgi:hypothetical protein